MPLLRTVTVHPGQGNAGAGICVLQYKLWTIEDLAAGAADLIYPQAEVGTDQRVAIYGYFGQPVVGASATYFFRTNPGAVRMGPFQSTATQTSIPQMSVLPLGPPIILGPAGQGCEFVANATNAGVMRGMVIAALCTAQASA